MVRQKKSPISNKKADYFLDFRIKNIFGKTIFKAKNDMLERGIDKLIFFDTDKLQNRKKRKGTIAYLGMIPVFLAFISLIWATLSYVDTANLYIDNYFYNEEELGLLQYVYPDEFQRATTVREELNLKARRANDLTLLFSGAMGVLVLGFYIRYRKTSRNIP